MRPVGGRRYKNIGNRSGSNVSQNSRMRRFRDARQILKVNRFGKQRKTFAQRNSNRQTYTRQRLNPVSGKHVSVKGGMITVTKAQDEEMNIEKQVFANEDGITVTKPNYLSTTNNSLSDYLSTTKLSQTRNTFISVEDDDLEKLTLDDLPEAKKTETPKSNLQDVFRSQHYLSSLNMSPLHTTNRMQIHSNITEPGNSLPQGYSVLVTNLHREVSEEDVVELFNDVGIVIGVQMIQSGTALVVYLNQDEALMACESYHNRLLDGQPMQCTLLPSSSMSSIKRSGRLGNRLSPLVHTPLTRSSLSQFSTYRQPSRTAVVSETSSRPVNFTVRMP